MKLEKVNRSLIIQPKSDTILALMVFWVGAFAVMVLFFPTSILRIWLGLPLLTIFPGYILLSLILPHKDDLTTFERWALSFTISLTLVPLIGLALNYASWGISQASVVIAVSAFTVIIAVAAAIRERLLPSPEKFLLPLLFPIHGKDIYDKALSGVLTIVATSSVILLAHFILNPASGESFTEFYILGLANEAANYPRELKIGEETEVVIGVINREQSPASYRVEVSVDGEKCAEVSPFSLDDGEKKQQVVIFAPKRTEQLCQLEFTIYKDGEISPYLKPLYLWVRVNE